MEIYNSLSRQKEEFNPLKPPFVALYTCGPTVYGPGHLGHFRTYISLDILKRVLLSNKFEVKHVLNITDVHDSMIEEAFSRQRRTDSARHCSIFELADEYINLFKKDLEELNVLPASVYPRVTEVIPEIIEMIKTLIDKGFSYVAPDGSVYFQVSKFENYGKLSGIKIDEALAGTRVESDKYEREAATDFALWKVPAGDSPEYAEAAATSALWDSPWGKGRPGWHIECSVMAKKFLDNTLDIHAGAMDLKFPHHENEIAQSEAANGVPFARYWLHTGLLDIEGQKMSKSLGNIFVMKDLEARGFEPLAFRYLTLTAHYRSRMNFTWEGLEAAQTALRNLRAFANDVASGQGGVEGDEGSEKFQQQFTAALNDDLNAPQALATVWEVVKAFREGRLSQTETSNLLVEFDKILALDLFRETAQEIPIEVVKLAEERERMRQDGRFDEADNLRQKISELGYSVEDTPSGPKIKTI